MGTKKTVRLILILYLIIVSKESRAQFIFTDNIIEHVVVLFDTVVFDDLPIRKSQHYYTNEFSDTLLMNEVYTINKCTDLIVHYDQYERFSELEFIGFCPNIFFTYNNSFMRIHIPTRINSHEFEFVIILNKNDGLQKYETFVSLDKSYFYKRGLNIWLIEADSPAQKTR